MTNEQMLLNAAKAMGFEPQEDYYDEGFKVKKEEDSEHIYCWNPLESSADCAEMEDALSIDIGWGTDMLNDRITAAYYDGDAYICEYEAIFKDHANKGAARRYASTMVAAMIGEKL